MATGIPYSKNHNAANEVFLPEKTYTMELLYPGKQAEAEVLATPACLTHLQWSACQIMKQGIVSIMEITFQF